jgi:hypothetical protein
LSAQDDGQQSELESLLETETISEFCRHVGMEALLGGAPSEQIDTGAPELAGRWIR